MRQEAEEQARLDWLDEQDYKRERMARKITRTRKQNERDAKRAAKELVRILLYYCSSFLFLFVMMSLSLSYPSITAYLHSLTRHDA
jgi:hypothetical protein